MAIPDESAIPRNTLTLKTWIVQKVFEEQFGEKIGFSQETDSADLWPAKSVVNIIIKKMELLSPGLTQERNGDKIVPRPIQEAIKRRFDEERNKKRDELRLLPKFKGMVQ